MCALAQKVICMAFVLSLDWWFQLVAVFCDLAGNIHHICASTRAMGY